MKVLLDNIIYSKAKNGGISNYWYELSKHLMNIKDVDLQFFEEANSELNFHRQKLKIPAKDIILTKKRSPLLARLLPIEYQSDEKLIYHSSYYRKLSGCKNQIEVTTVYDFIHSYFFPIHKKIIHNNLKFNAIKRSKGVICISKNTYSDLQRFCPTKKHQKAEVIYVGVSDDYFPIKEMNEKQLSFLKKYNIEPGFLLYVGGRTNYKNFDFAASILNEEKELKLVVVGGGNLSENELKLFSKEAIDRLIFIPSAENNELNILFNTATALLYPSSYEGFGIPVIEAMRAACPVIGLNNATIREVAENAALLLDSASVQDFRIQKQRLTNADFRLETISKGLQESQKYSWDRCNRETYEFYQSLY